MRKLILFAASVLVAAGLNAAETSVKKTDCNATPEGAACAAAESVLTPKEQYKRFKARNKEIRKLTKQYRKAKSEEKKAQIKARLTQIVSEATDEGLARSRVRIAAERANLDQWEKSLQEQEASLEQVKAQRVDDILSGEAERRHKLAQKRWKQEIKDRKKYMK